MNNRSRLRRGALLAALLALLAAGSVPLALRAVGWWIDSSGQPVKSDVLVVLAGDFDRELFAADLYARGFAPEVWISRPRPESSSARLDAIGVELPREEAVDREILVKSGVPENRIHLYGRDVVSTADEAEALRDAFPSAGRKILVVTSGYHVRRARMIFRRFLPDADMRFVAAPRENSGKPWWKDKELAENASLEILKTLYYSAGGRMK